VRNDVLALVNAYFQTSASRHVSGASFSCLVCTTWTQVSGDQFLVPETLAENLGRVPWALTAAVPGTRLCRIIQRILHAICVPKIVKFGRHLTKLWQKQFCTVF